MEQIIIGALIILAGAAYAIYMWRKTGKRAMEMRYMRTAEIKDICELVDDLMATDPSYRHYVELKGNVQPKEPLTAPYSGRSVAYYEAACSSVCQEERVIRDSKGNTQRRMVKTEQVISNEKSATPFCLRDSSCDIAVTVDAGSFGNDMDLQSSCDRFESSNSAWSRSNSFRFSPMGGRTQFLGYRLTESSLALNQQVYVLGELYKMGEEYFIGRSTKQNKPSKLSYKSEEQILRETKNQRTMAVVIGIIALAVGLFVIFSR